ncbi:hypothetical protein DY000_02007161 [Brassica cretica]|uniref:Uncharacterized protein n=1 Tax=Brassica cretica TaxID=69181 RepID=A0ABQ7C0H5_BRACR|nr:hypothetical protein DY000_02007161 [Brassica cretica]
MQHCNPPLEIGHDQCWDDLASCFHGTQRILGMLSQNMKFIRIFVPEADGCVDLQGDLLVYLFDSKSPPSGRLSLIASIGMQHIPPSVDRLLVNFPQEIACLSYGPEDSIAGSWDRTGPWYCFRTLRCCWDPEVSLESEGRFWSPEAALDPEVTFRTCKKNFEPVGPEGHLGAPRFLQTLRSYLGLGGHFEPGGIDFLQTPGRTPASGSPLGGTPGLRYEVLRIRS